MGHLTYGIAYSRGLLVKAWSGGVPTFFAPKALISDVRAELDRRASLMRPFVKSGRAPVIVSPPPERRYGVCQSCGDPLPPYQGGQCTFCIAAYWRAAKE